VSAAQIAAAVGGRWPGLVFLSGCSTSGSPNAGLVASMAEALVDAGALTVLGWALPVGDVSASALAAALYRALADGADLAQAVAAARRALFEGRSPYWHLLRLYADRTPMAPAVTPLRTPGRVRLRSRSTSTLFLDAAGQVKVADRAGFVGRRRELQALLRHLRPDDPATGPQVAVLHGMGGLGKSTLAARLLDRMRATHPQHAVWVGRLDEQQIITVTGRLSLSDPAIDQSVNELLNLPGTTLADRLRYVLDGPLADIGCVFVFDDFESGNLDPDGRGGYQVSAAALEVLRAFATAIARTGSPSRVVITSRHYFPLPPDVRVVAQPVSGLVDADLDKKLRLTVNLGPTGQLDAAVKQRAITASAGVPRLLETLDNLLGITVGDLDVLFAAIEATEVEYREQLLLQQLMDRQPTQVRQAIALAAIYEIAVPIEAIEALSPDEPIRNSIEAAVAVGLIQAGLHPTTNETRYLASPLLAPLVDAMPEQLDERQRREAQQRGAYYLYRRWVQPDAQ
jgi:hypothetical protein